MRRDSNAHSKDKMKNKKEEDKKIKNKQTSFDEIT